MDKEILVTEEEYEKRLSIWKTPVKLSQIEDGIVDCRKPRKILQNLYYNFPCLDDSLQVKAINYRLYFEHENGGDSVIKPIKLSQIRAYMKKMFNDFGNPNPRSACYENTYHQTYFGPDTGVLPYPPLKTANNNDFVINDEVYGNVLEDFKPPFFLTCKGLKLKRFYINKNQGR